MKTNENVKIVGKSVVLIPYEKEHVDRYNKWMQDEQLRELTASEALSLEQEYQMQQSWRNDENKCTFIVLDKRKISSQDPHHIDAMVGDVNLFLSSTTDDVQGNVAEIEVMIAEPTARRKGFGKEALCLMMLYGVKELNLLKFTAKIGLQNLPSLALFDKLGYSEVSRSEVFNEVTLQLPITKDVTEQ